MGRKALGRGLSALLGEDSREPSSNENFQDIDIDLVKPNKDQPRSSFPEPELEELTQSIRSNGVVQPILVRKQGSYFQLVAGERRWRAAQKAGLKKIPAVVREISDDKMLEIALIENIQRQELNPVEEALAYKKLINDLGVTQQAVADRVGKTRPFVANYLRILSLPKPILAYVSDGQISVGHAKALLSIDDKGRQRALANKILVEGLSVRDAEKEAKQRVARRSVSKKPSAVDPNVRKAETKLRRKFGTQVKISPAANGKSGKIEFEYYGNDDLDRIYNLLMDK